MSKPSIVSSILRSSLVLACAAAASPIISGCGPQGSRVNEDDPATRPGYTQQVMAISDAEIARLNGFAAFANDRDLPRPPEYPAKLFGTRYTGVTDALGDLVIEEQWSDENTPEGRFSTAKWDASSQITPWSGWFYPYEEPTLYRMSDGLAPLQKYDLITGRFSAQAEEKFSEHASGGASWQGHCDALALASIMEPEPKGTITRTGRRGERVDLDIADQKALLTKLYLYDNIEVLEDYPRGKSNGRADRKLTMFGSRFSGGNPRTANQQDIYPEQFHKFLMFELREQGRPFIMDWDSGDAVWNSPVYNANVTMRRTKAKLDLGDREVEVSVLRTHAILHTPSNKVADANRSRASLNRIERSPQEFEYDYDLVISEDRGGKQKIAFGVWKRDDTNTSGDSLSNHPDSIIAIPKRIRLNSSRDNRELVPDEVLRVLGRQR